MFESEPVNNAIEKIFPYVLMTVFAVALGMLMLLVFSIMSDMSTKSSAYRAYTECLREMRDQPIDVKNMFCSKIKDQL